MIEFNQKFKCDSGKIRYLLIPPEWIKWLADVFMVGYKRHGKDNWKKVEIERYEDALIRHWQAYRFGNMINSEDENVFHLAQVSWNALAILHIHQSIQPLDNIVDANEKLVKELKDAKD